MGGDRSWKIAVYESQRAHELELNKATAAFEHAVMAPLFLLNGGAAVAFLALLGAASTTDSTLLVDPELAAWAIGAWATGLFLAMWAVAFGYHSQRNFTKSVRLRRQLLEHHLLGFDDDFRAVLTPLPSKKKTRKHHAKSRRRDRNDDETAASKKSTPSDGVRSVLSTTRLPTEHDPHPIQCRATRLQMVWLACSTLSSLLFLTGVALASRAVLA